MDFFFFFLSRQPENLHTFLMLFFLFGLLYLHIIQGIETNIPWAYAIIVFLPTWPVENRSLSSCRNMTCFKKLIYLMSSVNVMEY